MIELMGFRKDFYLCKWGYMFVYGLFVFKINIVNERSSDIGY